MSGVTFQFNSHVLKSLLKESHDESTYQICPKKFTKFVHKKFTHFVTFLQLFGSPIKKSNINEQ